jgi:DNA replication protein DnaC
MLEKVPPLFQGKTFADFNVDYPEQTAVKNIVMRYVATFPARVAQGNGLTFEGSTGTGKTLLALIMYQVLAKAGFTVHYEPSLQFLRQLRDKSFESYASFQQIVAKYEYSQLLILDEVTEGIVKGGELTSWEP